jgi:predicted nucleotidyltransferase
VSLDLLEQAVEDLGDELLPQVVFVGAATLVLWITDEAAPPLRPTADVDVVVEIASRLGYAHFEESLRDRGFRGDERVICRWHHRRSGLMLDAMPVDARILGFENTWQREAVAETVAVNLPTGAAIRCASPAYLFATKLEAFRGRGKGDLLGSKDFQDIAALLDGRAELVEEIGTSPGRLRRFVATAARDLLDHPNLVEGLEGAMPLGHASQERAALVVEPRLRELAAVG